MEIRAEPSGLEVKKQLASSVHECDGCPEMIEDGTFYMRVSEVYNRGTRRRKRLPSARMVWKYHPHCWREDA